MIKNSVSIIIAAIIILISGCHREPAEKPAAGTEVTDDMGRKVRLEILPAKIVSLAPNITEMIFMLGASDKLAGRTAYCNYPPEAVKTEVVGDLLNINYEKLLKIKPDLVIMTIEGNTKEAFNKLEDLGIKVFVSNPRNFEGIKKTYKDIGKLTGMELKAVKTAAAWDSTLTRIKNESSFFKKRTAMFLVELVPVMVAGAKTFMNEYLEYCGFVNFAGDSPFNYPVFSREEIIKRNPDYIIYPWDGKEDKNVIKNTYPEWRSLKAIKENKIFYADRDLFFRPGPRFAEALELMFNEVRRLNQNHPPK